MCVTTHNIDKTEWSYMCVRGVSFVYVVSGHTCVRGVSFVYVVSGHTCVLGVSVLSMLTPLIHVC